MTVTTWCPDCEAICYDHTTICTTCGATLLTAPPNNSVLSSVRSNDVRIRPLDLFGLDEFRNNNRNTEQQQQQRNNTTTTATTTNNERNTNTNNNNTTTTGNSESNNTTTNTTAAGTGTAAGTTGTRPRSASIRLLRNDIQSVSDEVRNLIRSIHEHIVSVDAEQQALLQELIAFRDEWQQIPAILLDPNNTVTNNHNNKPTNDEYLQKIPRIILQDDSSIFHPASLTLVMTTNSNNDNNIDTTNNSTITCTNIPVIPAEFGTEYCHRIYHTTTTTTTCTDSTMMGTPDNSTTSNDIISYENAYLVVADPITGIGGSLRQCCYNEIDSIRQYHMKLWSDEQQKESSSLTTTVPPPINIILFFKRGDNITFVQKALLAQKYPINAVACIIGNNTSEPWPYTMKDSKNESSSQPHTLLNIPVVMTSLQDCQTILQQAITCKKHNSYLQCNFTIQRRIQYSQQQNQQHGSSSTSTSSTNQQQQHPLECIICTEVFSVGQTIIQLPCQHLFHETCAVQWLSKHNTCPYCRHELPTTSSDGTTTRSTPATTTGAGTNNNNNNNNNTTFYG